jgi:hypothetical protein
MSAQIIILPVIRAMNAPSTDSSSLVEIEIGLDRAIMNRLCAEATKNHASVELTAGALIVLALAAIAKKSVDEFYTTLNL